MRRVSIKGLRGWCLCITIVAGAVSWSLHLMSFLHAKEATLYAGMLATGMFWFVETGPCGGFRTFMPFFVFLTFQLFLWCTGLGSHVPSFALAEIIRWFVLLWPMLFIWDLLHDPVWRERIQNAVIASAIAVAVLGLIQYANVLPWLFPTFPHYDQRMYSVFGNQDLLGGYVAIAMPLVAWKLIRARTSRIRAIVFPVLAFLILGVTLALSGSRSAWASALAGVTVALVGSLGETARDPRNLRGAALLIVLLVFSTSAAVLINPTQTFQRARHTFGAKDGGGNARLWFWSGTLLMIRDHGVAGVGLGNFPYWSPRYMGDAAAANPSLYHNDIPVEHAHNELLEFIAECGVAGLLFLVWLALQPRERNFAAASALTALGVFSLFNAAFHSAPHAFAGLMLFGMLLWDEERPWRIPRALPLILFAVAIFPMYSMIASSLRLRQAEDVDLAGGKALSLYEQVLREDPKNPEAAWQHANLLEERGDVTAAFKAYRELLALQDSGELYAALERSAAKLGMNEAALRWHEEFLRRLPWMRAGA